MTNENSITLNGRKQPTLYAGWKWWLLSALAWSVIGTIWSMYFHARGALLGESVSTARYFVSGLVIFSFWFFATPLVVRLATRFQFTPPHRWRHILYHAAFTALTFFLHAGWLVLVAPTTFSLFGWDTWERYWANLTIVDLLFNIRGPVDVVIYWGIVLGRYTVEYYRRFRERDLRASQLETQLAQAQLASIRMYVQPHFLFNSLHSIVALIQSDNKSGAIKVTVGLSDLLRRILSESHRHEATVKEELTFLRQYLDIEATRFQGRLVVEFAIEPDTESAMIPALLLQPLVENALIHGIGARTGPGTIHIIVARSGDELSVEVIDEGDGATQSQPPQLGSGLGLHITRERLRHMYGDNWSLSVDFDTVGRTVAKLRLPFYLRPLFPSGSIKH